MNINVRASSSSSSLALTANAQRPHQAGGAVADAAKALGMSTDDVTSALKSGKSLGDIADEKGIPRDTLATALKQGMPDELKAKGNTDEVVDKIIDQVGGPQGPGGKGGPQGPPPPPRSSASDSSSGIYGDSLTTEQQSTLDKLADLLGTDSGSLLDDLKSGESLSTMLSDKNVSASKLADVLQTGLLIDTKA